MGEFQALVQIVGVPAAVAAIILVLGARGYWAFGREVDRALAAQTKAEAEQAAWRATAEKALAALETLSQERAG